MKSTNLTTRLEKKIGSVQQTQTTTTKTKQDGREQLRAGTLRSLARLLILSSRTETMRRLGLNLCRVFQFSTPPTVALGDVTLWSSDGTRAIISTALPMDWLVTEMERGLRHCRVLILWELMFAVSKHWQIQQRGRGKIDMHLSGGCTSWCNRKDKWDEML